MAYLGGIDDDERALFSGMILHFVQALNAERNRTADLTRELDCMRERVQLLEAAAYGLI